MNLDCFLKRYTDVLFNDRNDNIFNTLNMLTGGTTSSRIGKLLNFAVSQIEKNECYVEVGVFTGGTLCAANYMNERKAIGIDSYKEDNLNEMASIPASQVRDRARSNILSLVKNTTLIEKDFRDVTKEEIGSPIAVSFVDGKHDFEDVTKNLEWLEPLLADFAVIILDDVNYFDVSKAIFAWIKDHPDSYQLLTYSMPYFLNEAYTTSLIDRFLNNGVAVMLYRRLSEGNIGMINPNKPKGEN